jgi:uncharacterized protein YndB with AHSA1/START domain
VSTASDDSYTRTYLIEATREQVHQALTDPQSISSWWNTTSTGYPFAAVSVLFAGQPPM